MNHKPKVRIIQKEDKSRTYILVSFLVIIIPVVLRKPLSIAGMNFFIFFDKLLSFGSGSSIMIGWILFGLFIGAVYGSWVAFRKYRLKAGTVLAPVAVACVFILILFLANRPLKSGSMVVQTMTAIARDFVDVRSDGHLQPNGNINYSHFNVTDLSDSTAWIASSKGRSINHEIAFTFKENIDDLKQCKCIGFSFKNGYTKSMNTWLNHNRVKELSLYHNSTFVSTFSLTDQFNVTETLHIEPIPIKSGDELRFYIRAVYSGKKYHEQVAITTLVPIIEYNE